MIPEIWVPVVNSKTIKNTFACVREDGVGEWREFALSGLCFFRDKVSEILSCFHAFQNQTILPSERSKHLLGQSKTSEILMSLGAFCVGCLISMISYDDFAQFRTCGGILSIESFESCPIVPL